MEQSCPAEKQFTELMEQHRLVIERYVHYRMPSSPDAEDVLQETWLAAYTHLDQLTNPEAAKSWFLTIARNQCALWYRKRFRRSAAEQSLPVPSGETALSENTCTILAGLPRESVRILQLYYIQGYRQKEIADRLGIPVGTVKSRLHTARERFRLHGNSLHLSAASKGKGTMPAAETNEYTKNFPMEVPRITITELPEPYTPVRSPEDAFIIPRIGETNSEGTYRYPAGKLTLVSTCRVPKAACIHEVDGVKVVRDTYNVGAGKLYRNESVWFSQMTDEYIRELGCLANLEEEDEYPTYVTTFLDREFNDITNAEDPVRGTPILIRENPVERDGTGYRIDTYNIRYTLGVFRLTIGERVFRASGILRVYHRSCCATVGYVSPEGRMLLLRWYETEDSIRQNDNYPPERKEAILENPAITVNGVRYILTEDRIGEICLAGTNE